MTLNCKAGDLAVKIKAEESDEIPVGALVVCIKFIDEITIYRGNRDYHFRGWLVEYQGTSGKDGAKWCCEDHKLRPIRDNDGEDETLTWAPVPDKVTA